jgi:DNA primase
MTSLTRRGSTSTKSDIQDKFAKVQFHLNYERILEELELETVEYHGEEWCPCPLPYGNHPHGDRNASFSINLERPNKMGLYNCFVCGGGNIIHLAAALKNLTASDAIEWIDQFIIGKEENFEEEVLFVLDSKDAIIDEEKMPEFPDDALFQYRFIHPWMLEQGLTHEAIKHFQMGYDEDREAIIIPHWWKGKLVGWQARDLTGLKKAKYINTPGFPRRSTVYNYDSVNGHEDLIVVESPKSVVKLWGLGFKNVVATFGAEVTSEQMTSLWSCEEKVYLWFDNDPAGAKGLRSATKYLRGVVDVWVVPPVTLEKGDPGDLTSHDEVQGYLDRAVSIVEMEL